MTSGVLHNLEGRVFGRLTVVSRSASERTPNGSTKAVWQCLCQCGKTTKVRSEALRGGTTTSCGCYRDECTSKRATTHGKSSTPTYESWRAMMSRCFYERDGHYHRYGGRGITVDATMRTFEGFLSVMGDRPPGHSLERVNNDGHYSPGNCVWLPDSRQQHNTSRTRRVTLNGTTMSLRDTCTTLGLDYKRVCGRLRIGWPAWKALELHGPTGLIDHKYDSSGKEDTCR